MSYAAVNEETSVWLSEAGMGSWSLNHKCHFHKQVSHRNPNKNMTLLGWTMAPVSDGESCSPLQLFETIHALYRICLWWDLMDPNLLKGKSTWIQFSFGKLVHIEAPRTLKWSLLLTKWEFFLSKKPMKLWSVVTVYSEKAHKTSSYFLSILTW